MINRHDKREEILRSLCAAPEGSGWREELREAVREFDPSSPADIARIGEMITEIRTTHGITEEELSAIVAEACEIPESLAPDGSSWRLPDGAEASDPDGEELHSPDGPEEEEEIRQACTVKVGTRDGTGDPVGSCRRPPSGKSLEDTIRAACGSLTGAAPGDGLQDEDGEEEGEELPEYSGEEDRLRAMVNQYLQELGAPVRIDPNAPESVLSRLPEGSAALLSSSASELDPALVTLKNVELLVRDREALSDLSDKEIIGIAALQAMHHAGIMEIPATMHFIDRVIVLRQARDRKRVNEFISALTGGRISIEQLLTLTRGAGASGAPEVHKPTMWEKWRAKRSGGSS